MYAMVIDTALTNTFDALVFIIIFIIMSIIGFFKNRRGVPGRLDYGLNTGDEDYRSGKGFQSGGHKSSAGRSRGFKGGGGGFSGGGAGRRG